MRLKSIKLAGFKSFVDPTTVRFPSNLASLVGPNGCGKSNLIDAVRWVMGESSAKQLRGTAMADVIFNGSGDRQPLGQASIELLFDNATGRIGGEYAAYNEIAVRRSITRDGQSDFLLNGTRCRRRDITDLFLGTGLGPRSYSIIEQGMISSLITARPDELRTYIEEAAGISKYRERRRDTENRIARTRENLARLTDLRDELGRQLARLQRQSKIAEKYRRHRAQQRDLEQQLLALRWRTLDTAAAAQKEQVTAAELEVEKRTAAELACASQIEKHRSTAAEQSDTLNAIQARYYQAGAEIARLEQTLQHREERRQQRAAELAQTDQSCVETRALIAADQTRARGWQAELEELARQRQQAETALKTTATALEQAEQRQAAAQQKWDHFTAQEQAAQRAAVAESRHTHAQQALESLEQRRTALATQLADQNPTAPECPDELQTQQAALDQRLAAATKTEQTQSQAIAAARTALHQQAADIDTLRTARQEARGRLASLEALQQAAVSAEPTDIENWLHTRDLATAPRLADQMQVAPGWEHAVETVLGSNLRALRLPDLTPIAEHLETLKTGTLTLVDDPLPAATTENEKNPH
ncbi:MAG: AAA family ATPase, partial [Cellvibrionales bacterium]|nr:AAA family ATPase [Cellvibrionales bacterium]